MAAPPQQGMGPQFQSDTLSGVCNECIAQMPWTTRKMNGLILVGTILGMFLGGYTAMDTTKIIQSYQIYRLFLSPIISAPGFGAIFNLLCILFIFAHGARVEMRKGSVFFAYAGVFIALVGNLLLFSFEAVLFASGQSLEVTNSSYVIYTSAGSFPLAIGIMTLECVLSSETEVERRFMCFPCNVPTKYYPIALVVLFSLFGIQLDLLFGMAAGYILGFISVVQPGINRIRSIENTSAVRRWSAEPLFFKVDGLAGADFQPFGMGMFGQQQQQQQQQNGNDQNSRQRGTFGSGRLGNVVGMRDLGSSDPQQAQPPSSASVPSSTSAARPSSAFSGQGYKLGASAAAPTIGSGTSTSSDAQAHSGLRSALADRYERLARGSASQSETSPSTAITIVPESQSSESTRGPVSEWPRRGPELAPMPISSQAPAKKEKKTEKPPSRTNRNGYTQLSTDVDTMSDDEEAPSDSRAGTGGSEEDNVRRLMDRGFTRDEAENALLVSNGNYQEALQYLNM